MKKVLVLVVCCFLPLPALAERELETVLEISAEQASLLLDNQIEEVLFVSSTHAARLLGDDDNVVEPLNIDQLNNMPATAAGHEEILYISPEAAEEMLGDKPH